ncbi:MAG: family 10 glycosylhydrolase [Muribaculaceae bacterium]|nr:family 10 glycosylhydrolase [Muribaculaceae bacterium]
MNFCKVMLSVAMLLTGCTLTVAGQTKAEVPKNELRSAWLASIVTGTSWPGSLVGTSEATAAEQKDALIAHIDQMVKYNCNALALQVRPMGDALYKSSCEPWSHFLTGGRGVAPTYDPLEFFVQECHARGIEAHAWINPFRLQKDKSPLTDYDREHIAKGWTLTYGNITIFDPGNPEVRQYIVDRVMEVVNNYDIDGIMFDDYFYCPGLPYKNVTSGYDYEEYKASGTSLSLADWRRENVNKMIEEVYIEIKDAKPWVRFGLSPRGIGGGPGGVAAREYNLPACPASAGDGMYNDIFCNPLAWMAAHTIDYISPQIYWATTQYNAPYQPICNWWVKASDALDVPFYSSVGAYRNYSAGQMGLQLNINRAENHDGDNGVVFYARGDMDQYDAELKEAMPTKALLPPMRFHEPVNPGKITSLTLSGNTLSCTKLDKVRYAFYAIPKTVTIKDAKNRTKTGMNAEYLLGFSYEPTFKLPNEKIGGFWYAVTPYDRFGYEWEATTLGETPSRPGPVPEIIAPENGTELTEGDLVLTVKRIEGASMQSVQISTDAQFNHVLLSVVKPTVTEGDELQFILPVSHFTDGTYHWRALVYCDGYDEGISDSRTFTINRNNGSDYTIITDGELYDFTDPMSNGRLLRLQNLWVRSETHGNSLGITNKHCRDFTVVDDVIYLANMDGVTSASAFRLLRYDAATGEELTPLELIPDEDYCDYHAPATTLTTDDAGNMIISGLALNSKSKLVVGKVNPADGKVTALAKMQLDIRIDHIDVVGDLTTDGYIIAASSQSTQAMRWHLKDGNLSEPKLFELGCNPGVAPRIQAVSADAAFIDGGKTPFHYYKLGEGTASGNFGEKKLPAEINGGAYFTLDGMPFLIYPHSHFTTGVAYTLEYGKSLPSSYEDLTPLWKFAPKHFGSVIPAGGDYGALAEVHTTDNSAMIYTYVSNNALAAYKMDIINPADVEVPTDGVSIRLTMNDGILDLGTEVDDVAVYNASGLMVAHCSGTSTVDLRGHHGLLIVRVIAAGQTKAVKILL